MEHLRTVENGTETVTVQLGRVRLALSADRAPGGPGASREAAGPARPPIDWPAFRRPGGGAADPRVGLLLSVDGSAVLEQGNRAAMLDAGDLAFLDPHRPHRISAAPGCRTLAVDFPAALAAVTAERTGLLTGSMWPGCTGSGALLSALLRSLATHLPKMDPRTAAPLGESLACLAAPLLAERIRTLTGDGYPERQELLLRVQAFVRENLPCPQLSPQVLASRHHVSLRYLQKVFEEQGGSPAKWIRDERLSRFCSDLRDPRYAHLSVAAIGQRSGLYRASHLSTLFRARYGVTPSEYRSAHTPVAEPA